MTTINAQVILPLICCGIQTGYIGKCNVVNHDKSIKSLFDNTLITKSVRLLCFKILLILFEFSQKQIKIKIWHSFDVRMNLENDAIIKINLYKIDKTDLIDNIFELSNEIKSLSKNKIILQIQLITKPSDICHDDYNNDNDSDSDNGIYEKTQNIYHYTTLYSFGQSNIYMQELLHQTLTDFIVDIMTSRP